MYSNENSFAIFVLILRVLFLLGVTAMAALISFSAGLTRQSFDVGIIPFNHVLVNDVDHYDPTTGNVP